MILGFPMVTEKTRIYGLPISRMCYGSSLGCLNRSGSRYVRTRLPLTSPWHQDRLTQIVTNTICFEDKRFLCCIIKAFRNLTLLEILKAVDYIASVDGFLFIVDVNDQFLDCPWKEAAQRRLRSDVREPALPRNWVQHMEDFKVHHVPRKLTSHSQAW